jgi:hypothetical protein
MLEQLFTLLVMILKLFEKPSISEAEKNEKMKAAKEREDGLKNGRPDADFWKGRGL